MYVVAFVLPLTLFIVRTTVLEKFGAATAGPLQAAMGISLAIGLVLIPLNGLLLLPFVNRALVAIRKHREAERFHQKLLLAMAIITFPPILFPDLALVVLYSSQFTKAASALYWFVLSEGMMQIVGVYATLMIGLDRLKANAPIMVVGMAANAALAILLVPSHGLAGAGLASFTSASLLALGTFFYLRTREGFGLSPSLALATTQLPDMPGESVR